MKILGAAAVASLDCEFVCDSLFSPLQHLTHRPPPSHTHFQFCLFLFHTYQRGGEKKLSSSSSTSPAHFLPCLSSISQSSTEPQPFPYFTLSAPTFLPSASCPSPFSQSQKHYDLLGSRYRGEKKADYI